MTDLGYIPEFALMLQQERPDDLTLLQLLFVIRQLQYMGDAVTTVEEASELVESTLEIIPEYLHQQAQLTFSPEDVSPKDLIK